MILVTKQYRLIVIIINNDNNNNTPMIARKSRRSRNIAFTSLSHSKSSVRVSDWLNLNDTLHLAAREARKCLC